jgi:hypothetical protein
LFDWFLVFFYTFITPIDIGLINSIFFIPIQKSRSIIAIATKANIAFFTTATQHTLTHITIGMSWEFCLTLHAIHLLL